MRNQMHATMAIWLVGAAFAIGQPAASDAGRASLGSEPTGAAKASEPVPSSEPLGWSRADYLWWRVKDAPLPIPLATQGGGNFDPLDVRFGAPGSRIILGGTDVGFGQANGGRISGGQWLNRERTLAWDVSGFVLESKTYFDFVGNDAVALGTITRPFIDANTGHQAGFGVELPGVYVGSLTLNATNRFWGADTNVRLGVYTDGASRVDVLAGFRYLGLNEKVLLTQRLAFLADIVDDRVQFDSFVDRFYTDNQFFGGQVGADAELQFGRFFVGVLGKVAAGSTHERVEITEAGLLVGPSNVGEYTREQFAYVCEGEVRVGCQALECLRIHVGYSCLYWSKVVRPGDQIDPVVNPNPLRFPAPPGGPARPTFAFNDTDFWAHGVSIGVELRY